MMAASHPPAPATGRLILRINDDLPGNGQGAFRADVTTTTQMATSVPNVIRLQEWEAGERLVAAGYGWAATYRGSTCSSEGLVISQSPSSSELFFDAPANVGITVGAGPDGNPWTWC